MSSNMMTLHEIALAWAKKQPEMVDDLLEAAPILDKVRWKPATHKLWNVAEKLTDIQGASFTRPDAPLPFMSSSSDLIHVDLATMGGIMEVPTQRALKFGGPEKYFAEHQPRILKKAGMDTEIQIVMKNWLKGAEDVKNLRSAGATGKGWFILATRFDEGGNVGLYDPDQFDSGRLLKIFPLNNGKEGYLRGPEHEGTLGFSVVYRGNFGYQLIDPKRTVSAIVNIDETHAPTAAQIDDMLADVRATPGDTFIFCGPRARIYGLNPYKLDHVELANSDTDAKTRVETWNGISIVASHNISEKIANIKA